MSRRFLVLSAPLALQAALAIWHTTLFNMLMAEFNAEQVAGCTEPLRRLWHSLRQDLTHVDLISDGVSDALTGAGGSISLALYTATSIRVGILLGEGRAERAKAAAHAGLWSAQSPALVSS